jgi:uncharacterized protein YndB with AHSA1/START domain
MPDAEPTSETSPAVVVSRRVAAPAQRVFDAWTTPELLQQWWGPGPVSCPEAHVDLRVGGRYRICNALPDGGMLWIEGEFAEVDPPRRLVYSWQHEPNLREPTRVTVTFEADGASTLVTVTHELLPLPAITEHTMGWNGCLEKLVALFAGA